MKMNEQSPVDKLSGLEQEFLKAELVKSFVSERVVTEVKIDWYGHLEIKSLGWNEYWGNTKSLSCELRETLDAVKSARDKYFHSGFDLNYAAGYCFQYFCLLWQLLLQSSRKFDSELKNLLGRVLAFENFAIQWYGERSGIAAGTSSHRNPAYLLCKIGRGKTPDDPKYLPLIFLTNNENSHLFYHYRQYRICKDPRFSLFVYPAVELDQRGGSFTLIESFTNGFSRKSDPRSRQRAKQIADGAILPFLKAVYDGSEQIDIDFVDLGGGDGLLVRHIWEHILKEGGQAKQNWFLNCSFVGLRTHNPARHFSKGGIKSNLAYLDYQQLDYTKWAQKAYSERSGPCSHDIVLMCRLLNNISTFEIKKTNDEGFLWYVMGKRVPPTILLKKSYRPQICLTPQNYRPEYLGLSNGNIQISHSGSAYRVISLTDYYKGVECYCGRAIQEDYVCYPIRQFNELSLIASDAESIIGKLIQIAKVVVIEDIDLTAAFLKQHIKKFQLNCCASAINIDARYSSQILAIANKDYANYLPGQKIC